MHLIGEQDQVILPKLLRSGCLQLPKLERAIGDSPTSLLDAILRHPGVVTEAGWLSAGVQNGLTRIPGLQLSEEVYAGRGVTAAELDEIESLCFFPAERNSRGTIVVVCPPFFPTPPYLDRILKGEHRVLSVGTPKELSECRLRFQSLRPLLRSEVAA